MGQPKCFFPDGIDRLNGYYVPIILMLIISWNTAAVFGYIGGEPYKCLVSSNAHDWL